MPALTKPRDTRQHASCKNYLDQDYIPVAANTRIFQGAIVAVDTATRLAVPSLGTVATHVAMGVAMGTVDNTVVGNVAGGKRVLVKFGTFVYPFSGAVLPYPGQKVFVLDDNTVTLVAAANARNAGICVRTTEFMVPGQTDDLRAGEIIVKLDGTSVI